MSKIGKGKFMTFTARIERPSPVYHPLTIKVNMPRVSGAVVSIPKENAARSEAYRRLVAARPCIHCGLEDHSQAAHGDEGKGARIKSDDRTCYPACTDGPERVGCHSLIGMTRIYSKEQRREMEADFARRTRAAIIAEGKWPKNLERIEE